MKPSSFHDKGPIIFSSSTDPVALHHDPVNPRPGPTPFTSSHSHSYLSASSSSSSPVGYHDSRREIKGSFSPNTASFPPVALPSHSSATTTTTNTNNAFCTSAGEDHTMQKCKETPRGEKDRRNTDQNVLPHCHGVDDDIRARHHHCEIRSHPPHTNCVVSPFSSPSAVSCLVCKTKITAPPALKTREEAETSQQKPHCTVDQRSPPSKGMGRYPSHPSSPFNPSHTNNSHWKHSSLFSGAPHPGGARYRPSSSPSYSKISPAAPLTFPLVSSFPTSQWKGELQYEEVALMQREAAFWYDAVNPHYETHDDIAYPIHPVGKARVEEEEEMMIPTWHGVPQESFFPRPSRWDCAAFEGEEAMIHTSLHSSSFSLEEDKEEEDEITGTSVEEEEEDWDYEGTPSHLPLEEEEEEEEEKWRQQKQMRDVDWVKSMTVRTSEVEGEEEEEIYIPPCPPIIVTPEAFSFNSKTTREGECTRGRAVIDCTEKRLMPPHNLDKTHKVRSGAYPTSSAGAAGRAAEEEKVEERKELGSPSGGEMDGQGLAVPGISYIRCPEQVSLSSKGPLLSSSCVFSSTTPSFSYSMNSASHKSTRDKEKGEENIAEKRVPCGIVQYPSSVGPSTSTTSITTKTSTPRIFNHRNEDMEHHHHTPPMTHLAQLISGGSTFDLSPSPGERQQPRGSLFPDTMSLSHLPFRLSDSNPPSPRCEDWDENGNKACNTVVEAVVKEEKEKGSEKRYHSNPVSSSFSYGSSSSTAAHFHSHQQNNVQNLSKNTCGSTGLPTPMKEELSENFFSTSSSPTAITRSPPGAPSGFPSLLSSFGVPVETSSKNKSDKEEMVRMGVHGTEGGQEAPSRSPVIGISSLGVHSSSWCAPRKEIHGIPSTGQAGKCCTSTRATTTTGNTTRSSNTHLTSTASSFFLPFQSKDLEASGEDIRCHADDGGEEVGVEDAADVGADLTVVNNVDNDSSRVCQTERGSAVTSVEPTIFDANRCRSGTGYSGHTESMEAPGLSFSTWSRNSMSTSPHSHTHKSLSFEWRERTDMGPLTNTNTPSIHNSSGSGASDDEGDTSNRNADRGQGPLLKVVQVCRIDDPPPSAAVSSVASPAVMWKRDTEKQEGSEKRSYSSLQLSFCESPLALHPLSLADLPPPSTSSHSQSSSSTPISMSSPSPHPPLLSSSGSCATPHSPPATQHKANSGEQKKKRLLFYASDSLSPLSTSPSCCLSSTSAFSSPASPLPTRPLACVEPPLAESSHPGKRKEENAFPAFSCAYHHHRDKGVLQKNSFSNFSEKIATTTTAAPVSTLSSPSGIERWDGVQRGDGSRDLLKKAKNNIVEEKSAEEREESIFFVSSSSSSSSCPSTPFYSCASHRIPQLASLSVTVSSRSVNTSLLSPSTTPGSTSSFNHVALPISVFPQKKPVSSLLETSPRHSPGWGSGRPLHTVLSSHTSPCSPQPSTLSVRAKSQEEREGGGKEKKELCEGEHAGYRPLQAYHEDPLLHGRWSQEKYSSLLSGASLRGLPSSPVTSISALKDRFFSLPTSAVSPVSLMSSSSSTSATNGNGNGSFDPHPSSSIACCPVAPPKMMEELTFSSRTNSSPSSSVRRQLLFESDSEEDATLPSLRS